jgi:hypothetical protein
MKRKNMDSRKRHLLISSTVAEAVIRSLLLLHLQYEKKKKKYVAPDEKPSTTLRPSRSPLVFTRY